jgi:hypothetical protein
VILLAQKVLKCGVKKEAGYLYFIDKDGDVARSKMARGGKKKAKAPAKKKAAAKKPAAKRTAAKKKKR